MQNWLYWILSAIGRCRFRVSVCWYWKFTSNWNAKHIRMLAISNSFDESCLTDEGWGRSEKYVIMKKFKILVGKSIAYLKIVSVRDSFFFVTFICGSAQLTKCGWNEQIMRNWTFTAFHLNIAKHWRKIQYTYLSNKLIVDALLWCDWFPFSLSHLFYFSFIFITLIHIQLLLAQTKDVTVRSPKTKIRSPKQAMFTTVRYNYCRQCTLCLLQ